MGEGGGKKEKEKTEKEKKKEEEGGIRMYKNIFLLLPLPIIIKLYTTK